MEAMEAPQLLGGLADRHSMHTFTTLVASARTRSVMNNQQREWRRYSHPCTASTHTLGCTARRELVQNVALHSLLALGELDCHLLQHRFAVTDRLGAKAGEQLGLGLSSSCRVAHVTIGVVVACSLQDVARALDVAAWQQRHTSPQAQPPHPPTNVLVHKLHERFALPFSHALVQHGRGVAMEAVTSTRVRRCGQARLKLLVGRVQPPQIAWSHTCTHTHTHAHMRTQHNHHHRERPQQ